MVRKQQERDSYKWWVLLTVSIGSLTVSLDNSILAVCLPQLARAFHTDSSVVGWVSIAYFITSQSLMLTLARIGDVKGRKKVYITGLAFYTFGLALCALSHNVGQLIFARTLQGIGAATIFSLSMAIAVAVFPDEERGRALGILSGLYSLGLVVGPVLGGFILDLLDWRAVFYIRGPLPLASLLLAWVIIKEQKSTEQHFQLDMAGSISLFGFLGSLLFFLSFFGKMGLTLPLLLLGVIAMACFVSFLIAEKRALQPIVDLALFKQRLFATATVSASLQTISASFMVFLLPFYLVEGLGSSGSTVGIYMAVQAVPMLAISPISGRLSDKIGSRFLTVFGMTVLCIGLLVLGRLGAHPTYVDIGIGVLLTGIGFGIFTPPNNSVVMGSVPKDMLGTASALVTAARQIGISSGIAISGALFSRYQSSYLIGFSKMGLDFSLAKKLASVNSFHDSLLVGLAIGCIGILVCLVRGRANEQRTGMTTV